jgi:hypothetical protein
MTMDILGVGRRVGPKNAGSGMEEERRNVEDVGGASP